ncbi:MAG TPA: hypothetical protein VLY04_10310 [Bryobacteraceae bacterium]|nr:hypothetical protein [Bryobacteraceae bacterium]
MTCPYCDGYDIHRLHWQDIFDIVLSWFGRWPYRCSQCTETFYLRLRSLPPRTSQVTVAQPSPGFRDTAAVDGPPSAKPAAASGDLVDCQEVNGTWVPENCEPAAAEAGTGTNSPPSPDSFPEADFICPPELAKYFTSLVQGNGSEQDEQMVRLLAFGSQAVPSA